MFLFVLWLNICSPSYYSSSAIHASHHFRLLILSFTPQKKLKGEKKNFSYGFFNRYSTLPFSSFFFFLQVETLFETCLVRPDNEASWDVSPTGNEQLFWKKELIPRVALKRGSNCAKSFSLKKKKKVLERKVLGLCVCGKNIVAEIDISEGFVMDKVMFCCGKYKGLVFWMFEVKNINCFESGCLDGWRLSRQILFVS